METGSPSAENRDATWPSFKFEDWKETGATLHLWLQIVGKLRLVQTPWVNHSWHVTLYLTSRGLTTSPIPYETRTFEIDFDFVSHELVVTSSDGQAARFPLDADRSPRSIGS